MFALSVQSPAVKSPAGSPREPGSSNARTESSRLSAVTVDLGRVMCGECCIGKVWGALGGVEGVQDIAAKPGDQTFVVYYDARKTGSGQFLTKLAQAGEATATVAVASESEGPGARRWVRTAKSR